MSVPSGVLNAQVYIPEILYLIPPANISGTPCQTNLLSMLLDLLNMMKIWVRRAASLAFCISAYPPHSLNRTLGYLVIRICCVFSRTRQCARSLYCGTCSSFRGSVITLFARLMHPPLFQMGILSGCRRQCTTPFAVSLCEGPESLAFFFIPHTDQRRRAYRQSWWAFFCIVRLSRGSLTIWNRIFFYQRRANHNVAVSLCHSLLEEPLPNFFIFKLHRN